MQRFSISVLVAAALVAVAASPADAETWHPSKFNKPSTCRSLWISLGDVPADTNEMTRDTTLVCHTRYVLSHDNATKTPDWVLEHWKKADLKKNFSRPQGKAFATEKRVPPVGRATNDDYTKTKSELARGHMAPSEDFAKSKAWLNESFIFSNVVPQIGTKFNSSIWATLEEEVRAAGRKRGEIYVVTGPVRGDAHVRSRDIAKSDNACGNEIKLEGPAKEAFVCAADNRKPNVFCPKGVAVPIGLFKIVYDPKKGDAYAFLMPNREYETGQNLDAARKTLNSFRVTVAVIERATGLRIFPSLPAAKQTQAVDQCAPGTLW
jgi:endonuclease G, mitochondrial